MDLLQIKLQIRLQLFRNRKCCKFLAENLNLENAKGGRRRTRHNIGIAKFIQQTPCIKTKGAALAGWTEQITFHWKRATVCDSRSLWLDLSVGVLWSLHFFSCGAQSVRLLRLALPCPVAHLFLDSSTLLFIEGEVDRRVFWVQPPCHKVQSLHGRKPKMKNGQRQSRKLRNNNGFGAVVCAVNGKSNETPRRRRLLRRR